MYSLFTSSTVWHWAQRVLKSLAPAEALPAPGVDIFIDWVGGLLKSVRKKKKERKIWDTSVKLEFIFFLIYKPPLSLAYCLLIRRFFHCSIPRPMKTMRCYWNWGGLKLKLFQPKRMIMMPWCFFSYGSGGFSGFHSLSFLHILYKITWIDFNLDVYVSHNLLSTEDWNGVYYAHIEFLQTQCRLPFSFRIILSSKEWTNEGFGLCIFAILQVERKENGLGSTESSSKSKTPIVITKNYGPLIIINCSKQQTIQQQLFQIIICMPCGRKVSCSFFFIDIIGYDFCCCSNDESFALMDSIRFSKASVSFTLVLLSTRSSSFASGIVSNWENMCMSCSCK